MANQAQEGALAPTSYKIAFSADPSYDAQAVAIPRRESYVWFVPTEVSMERAKQVAAKVGAKVIIGQAESAAQFDASVAAGVEAVIGNLSALRPDQLQMIKDGKMHFIHEQYWNVQPNLVRDDKNVPVDSAAIAVYDGHSEQSAGWRPSVQDYINAGRFKPGDSAYGPGMLPDDYAALPA